MANNHTSVMAPTECSPGHTPHPRKIRCSGRIATTSAAPIVRPGVMGLPYGSRGDSGRPKQLRRDCRVTVGVVVSGKVNAYLRRGDNTIAAVGMIEQSGLLACVMVSMRGACRIASTSEHQDMSVALGLPDARPGESCWMSTRVLACAALALNLDHPGPAAAPPTRFGAVWSGAGL